MPHQNCMWRRNILRLHANRFAQQKTNRAKCPIKIVCGGAIFCAFIPTVMIEHFPHLKIKKPLH